MTIFDRLERRFGWLAFPGFLRYYALFHVLVYVLQILRPDIGQLLEFDRAKILSGEIWRVATLFFANSQFGKFSPMSIIFLIFAVNIVFMVNDGLEDAWGTFKSTLFYYTGILLILVLNFAYPFTIPSSGFALYGAAFLAFATLFPKVEIRLFMIIPVQVRFLGMLTAAGILLNAIAQPVLLPFFLAAFANYFIWAGIPALRGTARVIESGQRKKRFNAAKGSVADAFHTCAACEKTDISDPRLSSASAAMARSIAPGTCRSDRRGGGGSPPSRASRRTQERYTRNRQDAKCAKELQMVALKSVSIPHHRDLRSV